LCSSLRSSPHHRKKLKDQADFLERAQDKLKLYDEMVETNRKLAEENLRLQAILFPDPDDPLAMKTPGHGLGEGLSEGWSKATTLCCRPGH